MNILNLGRVLFLSLLPLLAFANVNATLDKIAVLQGDSVTLTISASGNNIVFPQLQTVEGFEVLGTSQNSSIQIINGSITSTKYVSYTFIPKYSFNVPIYSVIIDGVEFNTEAIKLKVIKPSASKIGDDLLLQLKLSKNNAYVGEAIIASIYFKYKVGMPLVDVGLEEFNLKHFSIKQLKAGKPYEENGYIAIKQDFIITPQLAGDYNISKQVIEVALRERGTNMIRRTKIFSNELSLSINPLPNGVDIQGDFKIITSIDKNITKTNEPVNLTIKIIGFGNIEDIDEFKLNMENEVVYSSKPIINQYIKDNKYGGSFTQKISIIADKDYTIDPITFRYFDKNTKTIKAIKGKSFNIKVIGTKTTNPNIQIQKNNKNSIQIAPKIVYKYKTEDSYIKYLFAIIGLILGSIITFIILKPKNKQKLDKPLVIQVKKARDDKELYTVLLPYSNNLNITKFIKSLEENIYNNKKDKINKKMLLEIIEEENLE